jgi:transposase
LLAGDEAWMYLQATTMAVWSLRGLTPIVPVDPGRRKVGFYGTLNLKTGCDLVTRTLEFTSGTAAEHLELILATYPVENIRLWWDRAPWHGGAAVRAVLAANPRLEIVKFPVAAPDLNPQEQVWKQTRRMVSHNHLLPKLEPLADEFENYLKTTTFHTNFLERYGYTLVCPFLN